MWWFPGLFAMFFAFALTMLMLANSMATPTPHQGFFIKLFSGMLAVEGVLLIAAMLFIYLAEASHV